MEIPIHDIKGKELGKMILTDEVIEVLRITGVRMIFEYDIKENEFSVLAYLN